MINVLAVFTLANFYTKVSEFLFSSMTPSLKTHETTVVQINFGYRNLSCFWFHHAWRKKI